MLAVHPTAAVLTPCAYAESPGDSTGPLPCSFDEQELIEAMLAPDESAWVEFHKRYDRLIIRCIGKVTGRFASVVCAPDIREVHSTLVLQLLSNDMHKLRSFDPTRGIRFGTWIGMLATNAAYDHLRRMRREPIRSSLAEVETLRCERSDPFREVERKELEEMLAELLSSLSAKDRLFVTLHFDQGLDAEEVAARLNISVKTVYSKKHKIRTRLEHMLQRAELAA
ncbi:MAG: sigma-70 family RNA polymerase sigma factor [Polyangiaceae bacterium]|jgi:RNA polymerase sigma-70 factor (ECF subfamily)|nr:sigma-70 family RNA polymerase sigma factor [Polyangiaceae bacterium]